MKRLLMAVVLLTLGSLAQAQTCAPELEVAVEAGVTSVSTIYAHIDTYENPTGCPNVPLDVTSWTLTLKDPNGTESSFPLTLLNPMRVRFTPTSYGLYTLTAYGSNADGQTVRTIKFRKGPQ